MYFDFAHRADNWLFDVLVKQQAQSQTLDEQIIVVAIDDKSLTTILPIAGKWSWPRSVFGETLEAFSQSSHVRAIAFDILFSEPDIYRPDSDLYFNEVLASVDNIFMPMLVLNGEGGHVYQRSQWQQWLPINTSAKMPENINALLLLPHAVDRKNWRLGTINTHPDSDGVTRRYHLTEEQNNWQFNALVKVLIEFLNMSNTRLPTDNFILNWRSKAPLPVKTLSFVDVYMAAVNNDSGFFTQFDNKIVLIGVTAAGLYDVKLTPVSHNVPGIYVLATALDNLLNQNYLQPISVGWHVIAVTFPLTLMVLIFIAQSQYVKQFFLSTMVVICGSLLFTAIAIGLLKHQLVFYIATPIFVLLGAHLLFNLTFAVREYRHKRRAIEVFGRFIEPKVVTKLLEKNALQQNQLTQNVEVTVLFADIRNFTSLSEQNSAREVVDLLNQFFERQVKVIFKHGGTLDKFIGDCVMAFWGAPSNTKQDAALAIEAALEMQQELMAFKRQLPVKWQHFDIGIGLHTGHVVAGLIGTSLRLDYTVIGDAVNVASRIEGLTKELAQVLVSESTMSQAKQAFRFEYKGEFNVKGRVQAIKIYQPHRR